MLDRLHDLPGRIRRLACFVGVSLALHAATLVSVSPAGVVSAQHRGPAVPEPLHVTLGARRDAAFPADGAQAARAPAESAQPAEARGGDPGGADVPFPDRWYTAGELDVRAEPLAEVILDYPEELEGSGIPGRVRLLLFIDERGIVQRMRVTEAEPARVFDKAALRAWTHVRFAPAQKAGVAVKSQKLLELQFRP